MCLKFTRTSVYRYGSLNRAFFVHLSIYRKKKNTSSDLYEDLSFISQVYVQSFDIFLETEWKFSPFPYHIKQQFGQVPSSSRVVTVCRHCISRTPVKCLRSADISVTLVFLLYVCEATDYVSCREFYSFFARRRTAKLLLFGTPRGARVVPEKCWYLARS